MAEGGGRFPSGLGRMVCSASLSRWREARHPIMDEVRRPPPGQPAEESSCAQHYSLISHPCYLPLSRTRSIEEKRRSSSESGPMSTGGPPRPPPSLVQLATVTAIANIQRLSNISSIPDNIIEELFEVRRTPSTMS